jgi:predicted DCC family thiol-disulfide oxidoreductase YuxK
MEYHVIYDGNCNLCVNSIKLLEQFDQGQRFSYAPMQDQTTLARFGISPQDCELGVILIEESHPEQRWQGSLAIEAIGQLLSVGNLPLGKLFVEAYRRLPGAKWTGDRLYEQVRDHRYSLFGQQGSTYQSAYPVVQPGHLQPGHLQPGHLQPDSKIGCENSACGATTNPPNAKA